MTSLGFVSKSYPPLSREIAMASTPDTTGCRGDLSHWIGPSISRLNSCSDDLSWICLQESYSASFPRDFPWLQHQTRPLLDLSPRELFRLFPGAIRLFPARLPWLQHQTRRDVGGICLTELARPSVGSILAQMTSLGFVSERAIPPLSRSYPPLSREIAMASTLDTTGCRGDLSH